MGEGTRLSKRAGLRAHQIAFDELLSELTQDKKTVFNNEFQMVHRKVLQKLSKQYPDLTPAERKVCLLLRDGLSIKQMSGILKISNGAVRKYRYHVRQKMKLDRKRNLTSVLAGI